MLPGVWPLDLMLDGLVASGSVYSNVCFVSFEQNVITIQNCLQLYMKTFLLPGYFPSYVFCSVICFLFLMISNLFFFNSHILSLHTTAHQFSAGIAHRLLVPAGIPSFLLTWLPLSHPSHWWEIVFIFGDLELGEMENIWALLSSLPPVTNCKLSSLICSMWRLNHFSSRGHVH